MKLYENSALMKAINRENYHLRNVLYHREIYAILPRKKNNILRRKEVLEIIIIIVIFISRFTYFLIPVKHFGD